MRNVSTRKGLLLLFNIILLFSCNQKEEPSSLELWKQEIVETEMNFAEMSREEGVDKAFEAYAAENVVLMRNNKLVIGKGELRAYFENQKASIQDISLTWEPDFVDVSAAGDLGYTYGEYRISHKDSNGVTQENRGIFHTVWKRQSDGTWKFVWD